MSAVVVLTPLVIGSWPVITAAITAAVTSLGYTWVRTNENQVRLQTRARAEIEVEDSEVIEAGGMLEQVVVERDGLRAVFSRDETGALKLCVEGDSYTKAELKQFGEELIGRVTQQFVYHKLITELKDRNMNVVEEEVAEDRTIRIRVRGV